MAAHLHDSVLQTLALIQNNADDATTVARLARAQERDLRTWLFAAETADDTTLAGALRDLAAAVEDDHPVLVDVVTVGDCADAEAIRTVVTPPARPWSTPPSTPASPASTSTPRPRPRPSRSSSATAAPASTSTPWRPTATASATASSTGWTATAAAPRSVRRPVTAPRSACTCPCAPHPSPRRVMTEPARPVRPVSVVIVDDHAMFRAGVRAELAGAGAGEVDVVAEAADVAEAVAAIRAHQPEVVLLDVHLPGGGGVEVMRQAPSPQARYLALSVSDAAEDVIGTIRGGARGYVTKTITGPELVDAIARVADGDAVFSPRLAGFVLDAFAGSIDVAAVDEDLDRLTEREREVMRLIARGYAYKEVARSCSSRSRPSRPTCPRRCASCSSPAATSSPAGPPTAGCSSADRGRWA